MTSSLVILILDFLSQINSWHIVSASRLRVAHICRGPCLLAFYTVKGHVLVLYFITGNTHWLKTFVIRHCGIFGEKILCHFTILFYLPGYCSCPPLTVFIPILIVHHSPFITVSYLTSTTHTIS